MSWYQPDLSAEVDEVSLEENDVGNGFAALRIVSQLSQQLASLNMTFYLHIELLQGLTLISQSSRYGGYELKLALGSQQ
jgi:hypothetical protein